MSAKLLHALSDDNPDLQKQIGCMTGIFQLFDRQHFISGRRLYGHHHKRLPSSAHPHFSNNKIGAEESAVSPRTSFAKAQTINQKKIIDSSIDSQSSSSCSSSFSSVDYSRNSHSEPFSSSQSLKNAKKLYNPSIDKKNGALSSWSDQSNFMVQTGRQSIDFRDIVKDSMYREGQSLAVNSRTKQESADHLITQRDPPGSLQIPRSMDGSSFQGNDRKPRVPVDLNESLRVLASLKDGPWYVRESTGPTRHSDGMKDASFCSMLRECPRFSYDGREIPRNSFDSRENIKSTAKLKELPRLSLDGRDYPSRSSKLDVKVNCISKDLPHYTNQKNSENQQSPSIVAKLMGLEALPHSSQISETNEKTLNSKRIRNHSTGPSKLFEGNKSNTSSSRVLQDPVGAHGGNADTVKKLIGSQCFPIETAPWSLPEGSRLSIKNFRNDLPTKPQASQFIFSEVEKRLKDLKFQQSEKDLVAILDAMQARLQMDNQNVHAPAPKSYSSQTTKLKDRTMTGGDQMVSLPTKERRSPRALDSPIVIMKPAKTMSRSNVTIPLMHPDIVSFPVTNTLTRDSRQIDARRGSKKDKTWTQKSNSKNSGTQSQGDANKESNSKYDDKRQRLQNASARLLQLSSKPQNMIRDNTSSSPKSFGSSSPRLQLRKQEAERKSKPPNSLPVSIKPKKQTARQQDLGQRGSKLLTNSTHRSVESVPLEDQTSDLSNDTTRNLSHQGDAISVHSDSNISFASQLDIETLSLNHSLEMNVVIQNLSTECNMNVKSEDVSPHLGDERRLIASSVQPEQPSPISVLDQSFYKDDFLCSPEQKTPCSLNDGVNKCVRDVLIEDNSISSVVHRLSSTKRSLNFSSKSHENKLASVEDLVRKLQQINSSHDESTKDHIASLCEKTSPDHRYVSEMLLASGFLLKDFSCDTMNSILPHSSGNLINPDLFHVLEKTKASRHDKDQSDDEELPEQEKTDCERLHRRLLFDTANEILISKLPVLDAEPCLPTPKLATKALTGQRLLHDVCAEIDDLASDRSGNLDDILSELTGHLDNWSDQLDSSVVVLDIEKMIFKDLVDEVVTARGWASKTGKQNRNRHQAKLR